MLSIILLYLKQPTLGNRVLVTKTKYKVFIVSIESRKYSSNIHKIRKYFKAIKRKRQVRRGACLKQRIQKYLFRP